jgi:hypothetical protein
MTIGVAKAYSLTYATPPTGAPPCSPIVCGITQLGLNQLLIGLTPFVAFVRTIVCDVTRLGCNHFFVGLTTFVSIC